MMVNREDRSRRFRCVACREVFRLDHDEESGPRAVGLLPPPRNSRPARADDPAVSAEPVIPRPQRPAGCDLLPPRYEVPREIEEQVERATVAKTATAGPAGDLSSGLDINPDLLRIQLGDQAIRVRPLSRDDKDRRKRLRVAIVYLSGLLILIALFAWLMHRISV